MGLYRTTYRSSFMSSATSSLHREATVSLQAAHPHAQYTAQHCVRMRKLKFFLSSPQQTMLAARMQVCNYAVLAYVSTADRAGGRRAEQTVQRISFRQAQDRCLFWSCPRSTEA